MLRNKEIRLFFTLIFVIATLAAGTGFAIGTAAGLLSLAASAAFGAAFFFFTRARYRAIARLSGAIDRVLHGEDEAYISEMAEGELSILENEIAKMTLRIREQNRALQGEKQRLADALADISHQLRTPLTAANLILPLVEKAPEAKARKALLREMEELFLQMEWLLDALLKLSRLDAGIVPLKKEAVEVAALVRAAAHPLLIPLELHEIAPRCSVPEGMRIVADAGWLSQALENILKNCIQSAPRQSAIEIAARETPLFSEIVIRDQGKGFSAEDLPRVFERFYRGKGSETVGYGIGLALSKMIILRHGGSICAQNAPQGGAEFIIRFPK